MTGGEDTSGSVLQTTLNRRITATVSKHIVKTKSAGATPPEAYTCNALYHNTLRKLDILHAAPARVFLHHCWSNRELPQFNNTHITNRLHRQELSHAAPANFVLAIYRNINYFLYIHNVIFLTFVFDRNTAAHIRPRTNIYNCKRYCL